MSRDLHRGDPAAGLPVARESAGALAPYDPYLNASVPDDEIDLREIWRIVIKYRWTIAAFAGIVVATVLAASLLMRPVYQATTLLEIKPGASAVRFDNVANAEYAPREFKDTQAEILKSESVARAVIDKLALADHPEFTGEIRQRGFVTGLARLVAMVKAPLAGLLGGAPEAETAAAGDALLDPALVKERERVETFAARLDVDAYRNTSLVAVRFDAFSPQLAAEVANAVAGEYMRLNDERRFNSTASAKAYLQKEIERLQAKLESSERDLTDFARKHRVVDVEEKGNIMTVRLQELSSSLTEVQSERIAAEAMYKQAMNGHTEALPALLQEPLIKELKEEYTRLQGEYFKLSRIYKDAYPKLQQLRAQMEGVKASLDEESGKLITSLEVTYDALKDKEQLLAQAVEEHKLALLDLKDRAIQYNILKREWETNRELYTGLLERMKEVGVAAGVEVNNIAVIDAAAVPTRAYKPATLRNVAIAAVIGLFGGLGLAFLLAYLDNTIRTPDELERALQVPSLAVVPKMEPSEMPKTASLPVLAGGFHHRELSEALRSVRTSLMFASPRGAPKELLITSSASGEGKSTSASNLAIVMAQNGSRVLLIDADLRRPVVHGIYGVPASPGLSDYLTGQSQQIVYPSQIENLDVIPSGIVPPNPTELLGSANMDRCLEQLGEGYDQIIIDGPPVLGLADSLILGTKVEGVLLVVCAGRVSRDAVRESVKRLRTVRTPLIGAVLNMVDTKSREYGYYYSRYYYQYHRDDRGGGAGVQAGQRSAA